MAAENAGLLQDTGFWVLLATAAFAVIAYKKGKKPVLAMLDGRTERIRKELEEAERLRIEAQELLAECQKKNRDAVQTAQKIVDTAKQTAARIEKEAAAALEETIRRREAQLIERIARAEAAAITELRQQAADIATRASETLLKESLGKQGSRLIDDAIGDISGRPN